MRKHRTKSKRYQGIFMSIILLLGTFLPLMGAQRVEAETVEQLDETVQLIAEASSDGITDIKDVRKSDENGKPVNVGEVFTITGVVTLENGIMGTQKSNLFLQDGTAGINVFGNFDHGITKINRGDRLEVTGKVIFYNGLTEFEVTALQRLNEGNDLPKPHELTIVDMTTYDKVEPFEGSLATVSGKVTASTLSGAGYNVTIADESGKTTLLRVMTATKINMETEIIIGKSYTFTGAIGQYTTKTPANDGYQLFLRDKDDIASILGLSQKEPTTGYKDTNVTFEAFATGAESVTVFYRSNDGTYSELLMSGDAHGRYTAILDHTKITGDEFEYYIEAKAGEKSKFAGSSDVPFKVELVPDLEGPIFYEETPFKDTKIEAPRPEISVLMEDPSGVAEETVKIYLDDKEITDEATISATQVKFTPTTDLEPAVHTVRVVAEDTKGNENEKEWTFEVLPRFKGGKHYRGTTHNHTDISHDATGTPEAALKAGQKYGYDFFAFSDHSHDIDPGLLGQDTVDHKGLPERTGAGGVDWKTTKDLAKQYTKEGDYVVFPAFEMTSTTWGHSNVFGTENFIDRNINGKMYQDLSQYYAWVLTNDDVVAQFNHPDMSKDAFDNFKPYDKELDKLFTMIEVGNGSGNYAYANAENKFFAALDLGWHVAPTYGEDNHDATWGKTNARTVIVADELTQESLLHSMRNMRVYMTEDPNFEMDVLANGYYMGSTVDSKTLKFDISGNDLVAESRENGYDYLRAGYKSDDRVKLVELVTNGGKVVDTYSPMTEEFNWIPEYTVASGQQWFVVRVTQMDGERAYSAPIWSKEETVDVKVNSIDIVGDVLIAGNPASLKTTVGNFGTQTIADLKVNLYLDEEVEKNLIGTSNIPKIVAKGTGSATIKWDTPTAGDHTIIAVVTSADLGKVQFSLPVHVKQPNGMTVLIDAKHANENSGGDSGTYKDNLKDFILLLQKEGYKVKENTVAITANVLKDVNVLVITHPRTALTADEQKAVADFVTAGGSLLAAGKSNNGTTDSTINNKLLEEIGTEIRASHDGVFDLSKEGNFWGDPKISPFAVRTYPGLVDNYITDRVPFIDYYSGSSLQGPNNTALTESETVKFLATGNDTTYQGNVKNDSYVYTIETNGTDGSKIPLIASDEIGDKGRIIVSGMNIFNDKQMDESYEPKGNAQFALNAVNWLAHQDTVVVDIVAARALPEDTNVVIEGTVTTAADVFFDAFYLQDETGGIMAFNEVPAGSLKLGDKVRIYGHIITFEDNKEIAFSEFDLDVIKIGHGDVIQPKEVKTGAATAEKNQGLLVKATGKVISISDDGSSYYINDGSGELIVFVDGYIANQSGKVPTMKVGDSLEAVGLSGNFAGGSRIRVRDTQELKVNSVTDPVVENPTPVDPKPETPSEPSKPTPPTPPVDPGKVVVDDKKVADQVNDSKTSKIEVTAPAPTQEKPDVKAEVSAEVLKSIAQSGKALVLKAGAIEVSVPSEVLKAISQATSGEVTFHVGLAKDTNAAGNGTTLSSVYEFSISAEKDGKKSTVATFKTPVSISIPVNMAAIKDSRKVAAYYVNEAKNTLEYLEGKYTNGKVEFKTNHFSKFVVVENNKTFKDIQTGGIKWVQDYVEVLASKSIIHGKSEDTFAPSDQITRAQFALLLSRSLDLPKQAYVGTFSDVTEKMDGLVLEIEAANRAGIVTGNNGKFQPNESITRQQMAAMIIRAIEYKDASILEGVNSKVVFADAASISDYAKEYVGLAAELGIISGRDVNGEKAFAPKENATRAHAAKMLYQLLEKF